MNSSMDEGHDKKIYNKNVLTLKKAPFAYKYIVSFLHMCV